MIQEKIGSLIQSHSKDFDQGIFSQMQHFLVTCADDFKNARDYHHISRVISNLYSMRKLIKQNTQTLPTKRHVTFKFLKTKLTPPGQRERTVLGILVGLNFLHEHEVFETAHLIKAIQHYLPKIHLVEGSAFIDKAETSLQTTYLEIEKRDGTDFTLDEIHLFRTSLPDQIKGNIEQLTHPIFMPRNDEEVLRNIMALSRQLRFVNDLPQVIISFDEQKGAELCFTVILLRIVDENGPSVQDLFKKAHTRIKYIPDRIRKVGHLRKKHIKEATVFRTLIPSYTVLRHDNSVDLYKAREYVLKELSQIIGEMRDYNGGMIVKQNESLAALRASLGKIAEQHNLLLEKFFYSLMPMEMRSVLETDPLKNLFLLLLQALKSDEKLRKKNGDWFFKQDSTRVFAILPLVDSFQKKRLAASLEALSISSHKLVFFSIEACEIPCLGYILLTENKEEQSQFLSILENVFTGLSC